jgi:hypothetical protein
MLWKWCIGVLAVASGIIVCGILGFVVGTYVGGNYAQNFAFLGVRGYEAAGLLGLIIGAIAGGALSLRLILAYYMVGNHPPGDLEITNGSHYND